MYYLMIKEIKETGLKYLCKRKQNLKYPNDHIKYRGSGKLWKRILDKHPEYTLITTVLGLFDSDELMTQGIFYSNLWNIVESKEWANLIPENGGGGQTHKGTHPFIHCSGNGRIIYRQLCPDDYVPYDQDRPPFKRIHNPKTQEIRQIGINQEIPIGFIAGGISGKFSYGPRKGITEVYNNGERKIYLEKGGVVPEGFSKGLHYEGTTKNKIGVYNPKTNEKKYIDSLDYIPDGFVEGLPPTTGKNISTPYGNFQTISECMRILNLTRNKIFQFIKSNPEGWKIINPNDWQAGMNIKTSIQIKKELTNDSTI